MRVEKCQTCFQSLSPAAVGVLQAEMKNFQEDGCLDNILKQLDARVFGHDDRISQSEDFFLMCCLRFKTESHRVQPLVQHYLQSFLGLTGSDLEYVADETNYLSTLLGLVLLSGFFQKPILLITSSASLKCLLDSQADRGAFKMIREIAEMRFYRIQVSSSAFLRQRQRQRREDFVAKVYARPFSDLHLLDAQQAERWGIEREFGPEGSTNYARSYKLRDVTRIPFIHNIPVPGSLLQTLLVTDDQIKTR